MLSRGTQTNEIFCNVSLIPMLASGVPLQVCDEILRQHSKKRLKVKEKLEASSLIQRAKFQARVERQRKRLREVVEANQELYSSKMEVEKHFLV